MDVILRFSFTWKKCAFGFGGHACLHIPALCSDANANTQVPLYFLATLSLSLFQATSAVQKGQQDPPPLTEQI